MSKSKDIPAPLSLLRWTSSSAIPWETERDIFKQLGAIDGRPRQLPDVVPVRVEGHGAEALLLQVEAAAQRVALGVVPDVVVVGLELDPLDEVTVGVALGDLTVEVVTRVAALINHRRLMYFFLVFFYNP